MYKLREYVDELVSTMVDPNENVGILMDKLMEDIMEKYLVLKLIRKLDLYITKTLVFICLYPQVSPSGALN